jgi:hypothetical protein
MQQLFFPLAAIGTLNAQPNRESFEQTSHVALSSSSPDGRQKWGRGVRCESRWEAFYCLVLVAMLIYHRTKLGEQLITRREARNRSHRWLHLQQTNNRT